MCPPPPFPLCHWQNRFDDPNRGFRTLYASEREETCLFERAGSGRSALRLGR